MYCKNCGKKLEDQQQVCLNCGKIIDERILDDETSSKKALYAGFWKRFAAIIIDGILINAISFGFGFLLGIFLVVIGQEALLDSLDLFFTSISILVIWLYFALLESSSLQGTIGKMAVGIKVTDMDENRISFGQATIRYFSKLLSALTFGIGYLLAGITEQKQALHDMIAKTLVINK